MPNPHHLTLVARQLKGRLNGKAFLTIDRSEITELLRQISGEDTTRIKSGIASDLERALLEQAVRCYPSLAATTTGDAIRLFHAGTLLGQLTDVLAHPASETDKELAELLTKIKGKWLHNS